MGRKLALNEQDENLAKKIRSAFSLSFKNVRESKDLRQLDLAERLGVTATTANKLERGHSRWNDELIAQVSGALGVDPADIFRAVADVLEGTAVPPAPTPPDPLRAKLLDLYERRDWTGLMGHLGALATAWESDGR